MVMDDRAYEGILCIGDPHLASRAIGARVDDYSSAILDKLAFCVSCAARENLLPALLGDVFHSPSEDADWLLDELAAMFEPIAAVGIFGNHDCSGDTLGAGDALARLADRGALTLLDEAHPWRGEIGGRRAVVGGTSWGRDLPRSFDPAAPGDGAAPELVVWLAHADLAVLSGGDGIEFQEIPGVDLVVNGHVHSQMPVVQRGATTWCNPGSISRYSGSATARGRQPAALRLDVGPSGLEPSWLPVPHTPGDQAFR